MSPSEILSAPPSAATRYVVLTGNPNCGKTTLFNALTGLRAKVGNYAGVTVERKEGRLIGSPRESPKVILDLPGTYSLSPQSLDEQISRDALFHRLPELPPADAVVVVVDASNLQRNLYFATQVIELGYPTVIALNMIDVAEENGHHIDAAALGGKLGVPVIPLVASKGNGVSELRAQILQLHTGTPRAPRRFADLPPAFEKEAAGLAEALAQTFPESKFQARAEAGLILSDERFLASSANHYPEAIRDEVRHARQRLESAGIDWRSAAIEARYARVSAIQQAVTTQTDAEADTLSDKLDRVLTHKFWGLLIFMLIMTAMFQSIFSFAELPMQGLEKGVEWVGQQVGGLIGPGPLRSLLVDGVIAGVGAVVVFLPQICLLFLFIGLLEDTGYMARAAFLMDRLMSKVGLHGKSFIPMLSSFACAIPGIMATRTIESPKDRLVTILVAPLMSCSARLPVYTVLIAACIPNQTVLGFLKLSGLTMLAMYLLGIVVALIMAWIFKRTLLKGPTPLLIMELPPYKRPLARIVLRHMWDRSRIFLRRAGTVILGISILLWFLATYPKSDDIARTYDGQRQQVQSANLQPAETEAKLSQIDKAEAGAMLRHSLAGRLGHVMEPVIRPLGFDWQIGIGIVASFAAREVFVSTMSLVYNVGELDDSDEGTQTLAEIMKTQRHPDGTPVYTTLVGITLMVFYVFALQCVSTVAVVRRETNSWKWPAFQWAYMGLLAWVLAFLTYQGGRLLGF
ncbi:MAG: ferrous iron transport protein B [Verrucomicrobia subdivision 3 bacterium]|nr:ferrous iron transport protein B [Limisphaerales bacterium]